MKRYIWFLLFFVVIHIPVSSQRNSDYGVFIGVAHYMGDINPTNYLYSPSPAFGIIYRYNFHPRHSVRGNLYWGGLRGSDLDFKNAYQQSRGFSFSGSVFELGAQFEFNFMPYSTTGKWWDYTPYFAGGVAVCFINTATFSYVPVIPLSVGFKINVYKNVGLEVEYGFRKTFYDNFDGLIDNIDPDHFSWAHNNDWYMFTGVTFTWKMFHNLSSCPAYADTENKRKKY